MKYLKKYENSQREEYKIGDYVILLSKIYPEMKIGDIYQITDINDNVIHKYIIEKPTILPTLANYTQIRKATKEEILNMIAKNYNL